MAGALIGVAAMFTSVIGGVSPAGAAGKAPLAPADASGSGVPGPSSGANPLAASKQAAASAAVVPGITRAQALADPALAYTDLRAVRPTAAKVDALRAQAVKKGSVRVLVTVAARYAPHGILTASQVAAQKATIAGLQKQVADASTPKGAEVIYTYDANIPTMAMSATPAALDELRNNPAVARVDEDALSPVNLDESVPLIGAADAQDRNFRGDGWAVAVLDTGADQTHPFLTGATVEQACYSSTGNCPGNVTSSTAAGSAVPCTYAASACRHGTHVSGIAIGTATASRPTLSGTADLGRLFPIQVFGRYTGDDCENSDEDPCALSAESDQLAGLNRVFARRAARNIASVNISIGGGDFTAACDTDTRKAAIDNLRGAGIATVISSGNDGYSNAVGAPGCISTAITVGAVDKNDVVPTFSNAAEMVDMLAPGVDIESSVPGTGYAFMQGTSMAAPHVAGAWAIMKARTNSMSVDSGELALESTGKLITDAAGGGLIRPRINVLQAMAQEVETMTNDQRIDHRNPIPYEHRYQTVTTSNYWSGVAIQPPATGDFDLTVYDVANYSQPLASSGFGGSTIDFVVQDSNRRALDATFPSVRRFSGTGRYAIEYENQVQTMGAVSQIDMGGGIIEMRDSAQNAGVPTYYRVYTTNAGQDPELFIMQSTLGSPGTYVQGRSAAVASSISHGVGSDEWLVHTSPTSQFVGLVVTNKEGDGEYFLYKDSTAPTGSVTINNNAASTNSRTVTLQTSATDTDTGMDGMRISTVSAAALNSAPWVSYQPTASVTLPATAGTKTVWVQYRNMALGPSAVFTDSITLNAVITPGVASIVEGNTGTKVINVPVTLSTPHTATVTAHWQTANNTAVTPADYVAGSGTVTFTAGQTSRTVPVTIKGDALDEANENVLVAFSSPTNAVIGGFGFSVATITDDDPLPVITPGTASIVEGNSGTKVINVPVTLSAASGRTVTASWTTANSSAVAPGDYTAASGTVTFTAGQTSKTVPVTIKGDALDEANEVFYVAFSNPTNATIGGVFGLAVATITDDDPVPVITAGVASIAEGASGTKVINVPVTLSAASGRSVTVSWTTVNNSAVAPGDYTAASGTVTFTAGQTSKTVAVTIRGDTTVEANESFFVQFSSPTNATILGNGRATATIINDD